MSDSADVTPGVVGHTLPLPLPMGLIHVTVTLRRLEGADASYEADFLVDTGATDSMATFGLVTALESVGIAVDPMTRTLKRLPAIPLKSVLA
jgi:hypothetical protein